ncbi:hypothetical protein [Paenibacillus alvei]|uniref:hypothetical protein n=1 Tax=Paenibacillus alvei TaxID=44250 RepID=UPI0013D95421|nr:hypothetical protein [Paenibacillus alvei]NEZ41590.1 hypothetical protein [Paenibacillus alvei]
MMSKYGEKMGRTVLLEMKIKRENTMKDLKMLKERKECMLFQTSEKDSRNGWIGGTHRLILMNEKACGSTTLS